MNSITPLHLIVGFACCFAPVAVIGSIVWLIVKANKRTPRI